MSNDTFRRHFLALLVVSVSLGAIEGGVYWFDWLLSLSVPLGVLGFTVYKWSGLRGALLAGLTIILFAVYHWEWYGLDGIIQVAIGAGLIAAPSGILKRAIKELAIQAEHYRLQAEDSLNGNRRKMEEALEALDRALQAEEVVDIKKFVQIARIKQADTLTLVGSWHQIAADKAAAIERLEQAKRDHTIGSYVEKLKDKAKGEGDSGK